MYTAIDVRRFGKENNCELRVDANNNATFYERVGLPLYLIDEYNFNENNITFKEIKFINCDWIGLSILFKTIFSRTVIL